MTAATASISPMTLADHAEALALWRATPGMRITDDDSLESTSRYLERNPGLSFVARVDGRLVGTILAGHEGRRGYLQHLAVAPGHRGQGIGSELVRRCLEALAREGIRKCHLFVLQDNSAGLAFWRKRGWEARTDVLMFSSATPTPAPPSR